MNVCHFTGRLASEPEVRTVNGNKTVAKFRLVVSRYYKKGDDFVEEPAFLDMELWDTGAERLVEKYHKGDPITVHCSVRQESWEDKNGGGKRSKLVFRVDRFEHPTFVKKNQDGESEKAEPAKKKREPKAQEPEPVSVGDGDDPIPF